MLTSLQLTNFRKFPRFTVKLTEANILVGPNNAGKSSILDAFRALDACLRQRRNPALLDCGLDGFHFGYRVNEDALPFKLTNIGHNYNDDDAVIEFKSAAEARIIIRLHPENGVLFYIIKEGSRLATNSKFRAATDTNLVIVPTLSPLEPDEQWVEDQTVQRNINTRLAARVLRNYWLRQSEENFARFRRHVEEAWPGVELRKPQRRGYSTAIEMFYAENRLDREVQWSGFGFQVWMQICTQLLRSNDKSTVIIDEPDVYLHPDLQKRLLNLVRRTCRQFVFATHATEIINEAETNEILSINPIFRSAKRLASDAEVGSALKYLGANGNVDLARMVKARKAIFVEGRDRKLLRRFGVRLGLGNLGDIAGVPIIQLGGFSEWRKATHAVWAFREVLNLDVEFRAVFDRDYRSDAQVETFLNEARTGGLGCAVLDRKELENYLLCPTALMNAINRKARERGIESLTLEEVHRLLWEINREFKHTVSSQRLVNAVPFARQTGDRRDDATIIKEQSELFEAQWTNLEAQLVLVPGKEVLARLNDALQTRGVGHLSHAAIVEHLTRNLFDARFIRLLESLSAFSGSSSMLSAA